MKQIVFLITTLFLMGAWSSCEKKPMPPDPPDPKEEPKPMELLWSSRIDMEREQGILSTDYVQQYKHMVLVGGDYDLPMTLYAFDKDSGKQLWKYVDTEHGLDRIETSTIYENLYIGLGNKGIFGFNLETKEIEWVIDLEELNFKYGDDLTIFNGKVYSAFGVMEGSIYRGTHIVEINPYTGDINVIYEKPVLRTSGGLSNAKYWFGKNGDLTMAINSFPEPGVNPPEERSQRLRCVNINRDSILWEVEVTDSFASGGIILYDDLIITEGDWSYYAFDKKTGERKWRYQLPIEWFDSWVNTRALLRGDRLFVNSTGHELACLDARTGEEIWYNEEAPNCSKEMTYYEKADYLVFACKGTGSVMIFDALTGEKILRSGPYEGKNFYANVVYDEERDAFYTITWKHIIGFEVNKVN